jgi:hypothetical protein
MALGTAFPTSVSLFGALRRDYFLLLISGKGLIIIVR